MLCLKFGFRLLTATLVGASSLAALGSTPRFRPTIVPVPSNAYFNVWAARGINDHGDIVGDWGSHQNGFSGFKYTQAGQFTDLGIYGAADINERGDILRTDSDQIKASDPREWNAYWARVDFADGHQEAIDPVSYEWSTARRINNKGEAAAFQWEERGAQHDRYGQTLVRNSSGVYEKLIYDKNGHQIFGPANGPFYSVNDARAINDSSAIAGVTAPQQGWTFPCQSYVYADGLATRVPGHGMATCINNAGTVAMLRWEEFYGELIRTDGSTVRIPQGMWVDMNEAEHLVSGAGGYLLWDDHVTLSLTDLLQDQYKSRYEVRAAYSINNHDQIAGMLWDKQLKRQFAVRLDPVPEPASLLALGVGLAVLAKRRKKGSGSAD